MSLAHRAPLADFLRRLFAAGGAALVFALTVFAASPELHERLHSATETEHDDACPVVLFSDGATPPAAALSAPIPLRTCHLLPPCAAREIFLSPPRYLRQPERGPPACLVS